MRRATAVILALGLTAAVVAPALAQDRPATGEKATTSGRKTSAGNVMGTVKTTASDAIVVVGRENDKDREWAFAIDGKTTIRKGQQAAVATDIKPGDRVSVTYTQRGGKVVAQTVLLADPAAPSMSEQAPPASSVPAPRKQ
jgi:hypothetical protein